MNGSRIGAAIGPAYATREFSTARINTACPPDNGGPMVAAVGPHPTHSRSLEMNEKRDTWKQTTVVVRVGP